MNKPKKNRCITIDTNSASKPSDGMSILLMSKNFLKVLTNLNLTFSKKFFLILCLMSTKNDLRNRKL